MAASVQMVSYDLRRPGRYYPELFATIESISPARWHSLESTWLVKTSLTSAQVLDRLKQHVDRNHKVLVTALGGDWATLGFDQQCNDWLRANL
jgi:hypothetical protein